MASKIDCLYCGERIRKECVKRHQGTLKHMKNIELYVLNNPATNNLQIKHAFEKSCHKTYSCNCCNLNFSRKDHFKNHLLSDRHMNTKERISDKIVDFFNSFDISILSFIF